MKKHLTTRQIKWIIAICLMFSFIVNISDAIEGFKKGWNYTRIVEVKK